MTDWILALDASTSRSILAIGEIGSPDLVSDVEDDSAHQASARLQPRIEALLVRAGIGARDLAAIACGRGPGTFTGTRVAVATAKGLALGLGVPIVPVSTLASIAASVPATRFVLPLLDARRGEVYGALFDTRNGDVVAKTTERCATLAELLAAFADDLGDQPAHLVGPGVVVQAEHVPPGWVTSAPPGPSDDGLWSATMAAHARGEAVDAADIDAVYLRQSYAELGLNTPKRKQFKSPFIAG